MKIKVALVCGGLIVAGLLFMNQAQFYSEGYARRIATDRFVEYCRDSKTDPASYNGPITVMMPKARWSYEWMTKKPQKYVMIGVWLNAAGQAEIYLEPEGM